MLYRRVRHSTREDGGGVAWFEGKDDKLYNVLVFAGVSRSSVGNLPCDVLPSINVLTVALTRPLCSDSGTHF